MQIKKKVGVVLSVAVGLLMASGSLFAHHSEAMFDKEHLTTVRGIVTQHELINPHQLIHMKVKDANGQVTQWVFQGTPPSMLRPVGWTKDSLKPGDEVTLTGFAYRDGQPGGTWLRIVKADGTVLPVNDFKKRFVGQYLEHHGKELSKEEYELYKAYIGKYAGEQTWRSQAPADEEKY